ncbi:MULTISPECIES: MlaD family protein [unclassified Mycobacterium]|uniref:MlaD family protein n=1 Tax=unclassified Mycobacterium TaxID=2642494 RepID=UPI0029C8AFB5|nr:MULTISPECIES: MlaD family protein [unclassified Mycobacterium]
MPDSIGLYIGNPVTQMGYEIGTVKTIKPAGGGAEIGFTVSEQRSIPQNVKAVIRSPSILADRALELVGNYESGPKLAPGDCIPLNHSSTPMSISKVIGSATNFVNGLSPDGSANIKDALRGIDEAVKGNGAPLNQLISTSAALLDNPDQTIADLGALTRNMAELTAMLKANREPAKQILQDMPVTGPDLASALEGGADLSKPLPELVQLVNDLELQLGPEVQLALDTVSDALRHLSPHYKGIANMLNPLPRFISGLAGEPADATAGALAKHLNNHLFNLLPWRPPLFRIRTPNGLVTCGVMNAAMPGSCADVAGQPYAVDVALLQYVLTVAAQR